MVCRLILIGGLHTPFMRKLTYNKQSFDHRKCEYHARWSESAALPCNFTRQVSSHLFQCLQVGWDFHKEHMQKNVRPLCSLKTLETYQHTILLCRIQTCSLGKPQPWFFHARLGATWWWYPPSTICGTLTSKHHLPVFRVSEWALFRPQGPMAGWESLCNWRFQAAKSSNYSWSLQPCFMTPEGNYHVGKHLVGLTIS